MASKFTGLIRHIDPLGRVVIPREIRSALHLRDNDTVDISTSGSNIVIRKYDANADMRTTVELLERMVEDHPHISDDDKQVFMDRIQDLNQLIDQQEALREQLPIPESKRPARQSAPVKAAKEQDPKEEPDEEPAFDEPAETQPPMSAIGPID